MAVPLTDAAKCGLKNATCARRSQSENVLESSAFIFRMKAEFNTVRGVHVEQPSGRATSWSQSGDSSVNNGKVIGPSISSRIEQIYLIPGFWIDAGKICSFICVAPVACISQPRWVVLILIDMLPGNNMLNMKANERRRFLRNVTVLATVVGAAPYEFSGCGIHVMRSDGR